jgi:hypothetical protein
VAARGVRDVSGGSAGLVAVLTERWDAIEADFARYYHLDLTDACFGPGQVGARKVLNLVRHLPSEGALGRVENPDWWWWRPEHEYLAVGAELAVARLESSERHRAVSTGRTFKQVVLPELPRPWRERTRAGFGDLIGRLPGEIEFVREEG